MISLYKIEKDKYGLYYISYGKKHRIKTLEKKNQRLYEKLVEECEYGFFSEEDLDYMYKHHENYINFHICGNYIQFGG